MRDTARLVRGLDELLGAPAPAGLRTGIEQEFMVADDGRHVDFRRWIAVGKVPGRRLDAVDPFAHRQRCGGVITLDGREAEIATPPSLLGPGFTGRLLDGRRRLLGTLQDSVAPAELVGVSTHLNVEVADARVVQVAHRFAERHAAAMMLLLDRRDSPGLLVRPRRGRLELGGEYAAGRQLVAATVFAAAAALDARRGRFGRPLAVPRLEAAVERYGWYVDQSAYGNRLYQEGRTGRIFDRRAQDLLDWSWSRSRRHVEDTVTPEELQAVDDVVDGSYPLPCELPDADDPSEELARGTGPRTADLTIPRTASGVVLRVRLATWDWSLLGLTHAGVERLVTVRSDRVEAFLTAFTEGRLAGWCDALFALPPSHLGVLAAGDRHRTSGVYRAAGPDVTLAPREREPLTGRIGGGESPPEQRRQKHRDQEQPPASRPARWSSARWPAIAGTVAAVVVLGGVAGAALRPGGEREPADRRLAGDTPAVSSPATSPLLKAHEELAGAAAGTYAVTTTVVDGNPNFPVGQKGNLRITLRQDCSAPDECTLALDPGREKWLAGSAGRLGAQSFRSSWIRTQPCPTGGPDIENAYRLSLQLNRAPRRISGLLRVRSLDLSSCTGTRSDPIAYRWEGRPL